MSQLYVFEMRFRALQTACIYRYSYLMRIGNVDMSALSFRYDNVSTFNVYKRLILRFCRLLWLCCRSSTPRIDFFTLPKKYAAKGFFVVVIVALYFELNFFVLETQSFSHFILCALFHAYCHHSISWIQSRLSKMAFSSHRLISNRTWFHVGVFATPVVILKCRSTHFGIPQ